VELYPPCFEFAGRILAALKHVLVITSTGMGKTIDMDLAHNTMKTAVNYRCAVGNNTRCVCYQVGVGCLCWEVCTQSMQARCV